MLPPGVDCMNQQSVHFSTNSIEHEGGYLVSRAKLHFDKYMGL